MAEKEFRNRVAEARSRAGLTQQQAAEALNMTQPGYQYYEYASRDIKASLLKKMSKLFGCSVLFLIGMNEEEIDQAPYSGFCLTKREEGLIRSFRSMDRTGQRVLLTLAEDMDDSGNHKLSQAK